MRKSAISIISSMVFLGMASSLYAAEISDYPPVEKQAKFYAIILGVIALSAFRVSALHLCLGLVDFKEKAATPTLQREKGVFAGERVAALQSAK
jgi:hypothetical protein